MEDTREIVGQSREEPGFERLKKDHPVTPEEMGTFFPYLLRTIPMPKEYKSEIACEPQSGEHARYGVFFYALTPEQLESLKIDETKFNVLVNTNSLLHLLDETNVMKRGVAVSPSPYVDKLRRDITERHVQAGERTDTMSFGYKVEEEITHGNILLDLGGKENPHLPIFTIPASIKIPRELLINPRYASGGLAA